MAKKIGIVSKPRKEDAGDILSELVKWLRDKSTEPLMDQETASLIEITSPYSRQDIAALSEFAGGILLVAGFLPRIAALAIAGVMIVAIIKVHWQNGFFMNHELTPGKWHGYEYALNLLAGALMILCAGAGKFSIMGILGGGKKEEGGGMPGKEEG